MFALAAVLAFVAQLKAGVLHQQHRHAKVVAPQVCGSLKCIKIGDPGPEGLPGRVTAISVPQPGALCVTGGDPRHQWQFCAVV